MVGWDGNVSLSGGVETDTAPFFATRALSIVHCLATEPVLALALDAKLCQSHRHSETEGRAEQAGRAGEDAIVVLGWCNLESGSDTT